MNEEENSENTVWSIQSFWNDLLESTKRYPAKSRDYISASDIGKDFWGRYQKMTGTETTNPFSDRTLRIFAAGDEFHHLIKNVFQALGIFINSQDDEDEDGRNQWSIIPATLKTLKVLGKYDALVGGKVNIEQTKETCERMQLSDFIKIRTIRMAEFLAEKYPDGLPELLYEVKSINSMAFWNKKDYLSNAYPHHILQCYAYLKANNKPEGRLLYISKDDLMMAEIPVYLNDPKLEKIFQEDVAKMTYYLLNQIEPPKPKDIIYNEKKKLRFQVDKKKQVITGCYDYNWEVSRSQYFKKLTGVETEKQWKSNCQVELSEKNKGLKDSYKTRRGLDVDKKVKKDKKEQLKIEDKEETNE